MRRGRSKVHKPEDISNLELKFVIKTLKDFLAHFPYSYKFGKDAPR